MKRLVLVIAAIVLLAGCAQHEPIEVEHVSFLSIDNETGHILLFRFHVTGDTEEHDYKEWVNGYRDGAFPLMAYTEYTMDVLLVSQTHNHIDGDFIYEVRDLIASDTFAFGSGRHAFHVVLTYENGNIRHEIKEG